MNLLPLALLALPAAPLQEPASTETKASPTDFLVLHVEDLRGSLVHPKDEALAAALGMIDERLAELPGELPDAPEIDPSLIGLATELAVGAKTIRMGFDPRANPSRGEMPFFASLALHTEGDEAAGVLAERVARALAGMGVPTGEPGADGLRRLPANDVPLSYGPSGNALLVRAGDAPEHPVTPPTVVLPEGVPVGMWMAMDVGAYLDGIFALVEANGGGGPEMALVQQLLARLGLDDLRMEAAYGVGAERSHSVLRMPGYGARMAELGLLPEETLSAEELRLVPADATFATVSRTDVEGTYELVVGIVRDLMAAQGAQGDPIAMIAGMTGYHPYDDFVALLGDTSGMYTSDTTGGGGLASLVLFTSLRDSDGMIDTKERLEELINGLALAQANGYVQVRSWTRDDVEYSTLTFPGLPVPLEPTIAITSTHLFVGATPQAAIGAVAHAASDAPGVLDAPGVRAQLPEGGLEGAYAFTYTNTERLARDGYGLTCLVGSALANGVRSRFDGLRDPGPIVPPFGELVAGVRPGVSVARVVDGDWVEVGHGDPSTLVNLAATAGFLKSSGLALLAPAMAGVAMWTTTAARDEAMVLEAYETEGPTRDH